MCSLLKFEVPSPHYLETRHFSRAPTHILSSLKPSLFAMVLSQPANKQKKIRVKYFCWQLIALVPEYKVLKFGDNKLL
jgi:hypothetical protein